MLSAGQILDVITIVGDESGVQVPDGFGEEFLKHFGAIELTGLNSVKKEFCKRVCQILDGAPDLDNKYGEFVDLVRYPVRLRLAVAMGLEKYTAEPMRGFTLSPRGVLLGFLKTLNKGQTWGKKELEKYRKDIDDAGRIAVQRVAAATGRFNLETVEVLLGPDSGVLLERNPFVGKHRFAVSMAGTRRHLKSFLSTLPEGEPWNYTSLEDFVFSDGYCGVSLVGGIARYGNGGCFDKTAVRKVLGGQADELLKRNPFTKRECVVVSEKIARKYLAQFLDQSIKAGVSEWNFETLLRWTSKDGVTGWTLYKWLLRNLDELSIDSLRTFLGDNSSLLNACPLNKAEKKIASMEDARKYLIRFLYLLPEGKSWSAVSLQLFGHIGNDGPAGGSLYEWIRSHGLFDGDFLYQILGDDYAYLLDSKPFEPERKIVNREAARKYLALFLGTLPEGQKWSGINLFWCGEIADGVRGWSLFGWMARNEANGVCEESIRLILGDEADKLLARTPFEKKSAIGVLKNIDDARKYLVLFLDSLPEGESWSPALLASSTQRLGSDGPSCSSLYTFICQNFRRDSEVDWLFVLVRLVPFEYLTRNPFRYNRQALVSTRPLTVQPTSIPPGHEVHVRLTVQDLRDPSAHTPEDILLRREEQAVLNRQLSALKMIIGALSPAERGIISVFCSTGDVPSGILNPIIERLKSLMFVKYPELFNEEGLDFGLEVLRSLLV